MWGCDAGGKSVAGAKLKEEKADHSIPACYKNIRFQTLKFLNYRYESTFITQTKWPEAVKMAKIRLKCTLEFFDEKEE